MIKARAKQSSGNDLIILGLSDMNEKKLSEGQPIKVNLKKDVARDLPDIDIMIIRGETEEKIAVSLGVPAISLETKGMTPQ